RLDQQGRRVTRVQPRMQLGDGDGGIVGRPEELHALTLVARVTSRGLRGNPGGPVGPLGLRWIEVGGAASVASEPLTVRAGPEMDPAGRRLDPPTGVGLQAMMTAAEVGEIAGDRGAGLRPVCGVGGVVERDLMIGVTPPRSTAITSP